MLKNKILKRAQFLIIVCCLVLVLIFNSSQVLADNMDDFHKQGMMGLFKDIFTVKGAVEFSLLFPELKQINNCLPAEFPHLSNPVILKGINLKAGFKEGGQLGAYLTQGRISSKNNNGKRVDLALKYGGIIYEQGIILTDKLNLSYGSLLGLGFASLELRYNNNQGIDTANCNLYKKSFLVIGPQVNLHYQIASMTGLDFSIAYFYDNKILDSDWRDFGRKVKPSFGSLSAPVISLKFSVGF